VYGRIGKHGVAVPELVVVATIAAGGRLGRYLRVVARNACQSSKARWNLAILSLAMRTVLMAYGRIGIHGLHAMPTRVSKASRCATV